LQARSTHPAPEYGDAQVSIQRADANPGHQADGTTVLVREQSEPEC
jgi:hypothetical protein